MTKQKAEQKNKRPKSSSTPVSNSPPRPKISIFQKNPKKHHAIRTNIKPNPVSRITQHKG